MVHWQSPYVLETGDHFPIAETRKRFISGCELQTCISHQHTVQTHRAHDSETIDALLS